MKCFHCRRRMYCRIPWFSCDDGDGAMRYYCTRHCFKLGNGIGDDRCRKRKGQGKEIGWLELHLAHTS
ncbi:hypothetical protein QKT49_gp133 [Acanthamoeba castellanii medusavirus]|uniref:Uncharacterized protein n=1 Tax=Acanthamoeba castellanii medusavirus J1 TaxID=3114988 RepID=A0A3T1CWR6_9VIRU|nr:hypothetical protein QKT49_gp133 [Acanthamoeba castellanii medusavirus]BBI30273.1 hypothetical protein [Acanthamoeba castellanii medusavirus J1]